MHVYLDDPLCNPMVIKNIPKTTKHYLRCWNFIMLIMFSWFFPHLDYFLGKGCLKINFIFNYFIIHKTCVWFFKHGSGRKYSNSMCNYFLLAFFLFILEDLSVELKIFKWRLSQLYVIFHNECNAKQNKM